MNTPEELIKKAQSLNEDEKYSDVIEALPDPILETHNSADLYAEKARAFYVLKKYEFSNAAADKALSINPEHAKANNYKGNISSDNQEYTKAIAFYNKAIASDPSDAYAFNGLGNTYSELKEYDKAIACMVKKRRKKPKVVP
jgi:tetratricopeptide (TPR) repeat protein